jgi:ketosteroid isomerase-like protein
MKKYLIDAMLMSGLIMFMVACGNKNEQTAAPTIDKEQIKKEIQEKENQFAAVYNAGEMKSIGYYADDAVSYSQNKEPLVGKQAIIDYLKSGIEESNKITFTTKEVFVSGDGNQVVEIGYYDLTDSAHVSINTGNYMVLFEKRNGSYVVVRDMSASDMPID